MTAANMEGLSTQRLETSAEIIELTAVDEADVSKLIESFKRSYREKGADDLESQIPFLSALARVYIRRAAEEPSQWTHLLRAHALYNSCAARAIEAGAKLQWQRKVYKVEAIFYGEHPLTETQHHEINGKHITALQAIREKLRLELKAITEVVASMNPADLRSEEQKMAEKHLIDSMKRVSAMCTNETVNYLEGLIRVCVELVGEPPCSMAVVALGSMARGEATPYSDLEYLFLVQQSQDSKYFEKLAIASYFLIGNLQETNLKCMSIKELSEGKWFADKAKSGLKIDGIGGNAGNIPTGNERRTKYFIRTPEELADDYQACFDKPSSDDHQTIGDLSDMLFSTRLIYSYQDGTQLHDKFLRTIYSVGVSAARFQATCKMLEKDCEKFCFDATDISTSSARQLLVKDQIFRFPTIFLEDVKILCKFRTRDSWETVSQIVEGHELCRDTEHSLSFLLAVALFVRLDAYLHYDSQVDKATVLLRLKPELSVGMYCFPRKLFHAYGSFIFPAKAAVSGICHTLSIEPSRSLLHGDIYANERISPTRAVFTDFQIERDTDMAKAYTHAFCLEWSDCFDHLQSTHLANNTLEELQGCGKMNPEECLDILASGAWAAIFCYKFDSGEQLCLRALKVLQSAIGIPSNRKTFWDKRWQKSLGRIFQERGQHAKALEIYKHVIELEKSSLGADAINNDLASSCYNVGHCLLELGRTEEALAYLQRALDIRKSLFGADAINNDLASSYNNVGSCLLALGRTEEALVYQQKALDISKSFFGADAINSHLASSYNNVGHCLGELGRTEEALAYQQKALDIFRSLYGADAKITDLASSYNNVGSSLLALGSKEKALEHLQKALDIRKQCFFGADAINRHLASSYNNVGHCLGKLGRTEEALAYQQKALDIFKSLFEADAINNTDLASSYNNVGHCLLELGRTDEALAYQQKALDIGKSTFGAEAINADLL